MEHGNSLLEGENIYMRIVRDHVQALVELFNVP